MLQFCYDGYGGNMELYGMKMHKDDLPPEKYTAEEFMSELKRYKEELREAVAENELESRRMKTLCSPIFYDYVKAHFNSGAEPEKKKVFLCSIGWLTEKYLRKVEEFEEILLKNPELAKEVAESVNKPLVPRDMIIPEPLDHDLEPFTLKKH